jgi:hypothetical protein
MENSTRPAPNAPRIVKQRGRAYFCESCEQDHAPMDYIEDGRPYHEQTPEQKAARDLAWRYRSHKKRARGTERGEAIKRLKGWLTPGKSEILISIPAVARSGMSRQMRVYADGGASCLTYNVALACELRYNRDRDALSISGCGMDMTFALVDDLANVLWPKGHKCADAKHCHYPREVADGPKGGRYYRPHARQHRTNGNWALKRRTL